MSEKLLSVIIPVYNIEKYLSECINSVINQTYKNIEIICVNDGSTDSSPQILKNFKNIDKRIVLIEKANAGLASARNTGIEYANGDYIAFLDSDDWLELDFYEKLIKRLEQDNSDIAIGETYYIFPDRIAKNDWVNRYNFKSNKNFIESVIEKQNIIYACACWNKVYKSELIKKNNLIFPDGLFIEDVPFTFQTTIYAKRISLVRGAILNYRRTNESIMAKAYNNRVPFDIFKIYEQCESCLNNVKINQEQKIQYKQILDNFEIFNIYTWSTFCCEKYQQEFFNIMKMKFKKINIIYNLPNLYFF